MKNSKAIKHIFLCGLLALCNSLIYAQNNKTVLQDSNLVNLNNELINKLSSDKAYLGNGLEMNKREISSAIGEVSGDELQKMNTISPANALYGLIPGLTVLQNSGSASWRDPNLYIRGLNTTGNRNILVLIDGIEGDIARLSSLSIESIKILKDASALAIYGQRGANGVLLVTTKRGIKQAMKVDVHFESGIHEATMLPSMLDAATYAERYNEALIYDGLNPLYSDNAIDMYRSGEYPTLYPNANWLDIGLKDWGKQTNFNTSFRGGDNKVNYFAELDYRAEDGLYTEDYNTTDYSTQLSYDRINFRTNLDLEVTNSTKFKTWVSGSIDETNQPGSNTSTTNASMFSTPANAFPVQNFNGNWGGTATHPNNPAAMISSTGYYRYQGFDILVKGAIEQDMSALLEGLSGELIAGHNMRSNSMDGKTQQYMYEDIQYTEATETTPADTTSIIYGQNTALTAQSGYGNLYRSAIFTSKLKYDKRAGDHIFNSFIMYSQSNYVGKGHYTTYLRQNIAAFLHYSYKEKYFGDITLSYAGTSQLPLENQFNLYPAVSLAWLVSEEDFINSNSAIKFLKIRSSFGFAGSDRITQNTNDTQYTNVGSYYFGSSNAYYWAAGVERLGGNPKTERAMMLNLGLDANLFGKLNITMDAFYNKRTNILVNSSGQTSGVIGITPPLAPIGVVNNKGFETAITWQDQKGSFLYSATGQFSFARNKIVEMGEKPQAYDYLQRTGKPIGQAFGLVSDGFFTNQDDINNNLPQMFSVLSPGDVKYIDQNEDNIIDELDVIAMQYSTIAPEIYYSLNLNAEYKNFGLNILIQGAANYTAYLSTTSIYKPFINNANISEFSENRWTEATAETATLPRLTTLDNDNNYRANDIWYTNRNFLKIRYVEAYYNFNLKTNNKLNISNMKLFVKGCNLFSFDKIDQMDPEMININYPATSTYNIGMKLNF